MPVQQFRQESVVESEFRRLNSEGNASNQNSEETRIWFQTRLQLSLEIHIGREPMKRLKQASALQGLRPGGFPRKPCQNGASSS